MGRAVSIEFDEASLRRFYRRIDPDNLIEKPLDSFYDRVATGIRDKARANAPEDLGELKKSIKKKKTRKGIVVLVEAPYGIFVHEGTRPHWPPISALEGWASRHGMSAFAVAAGIAKRGTRPQPFLRDAVKQEQRSLPIELQTTAQLIETSYGRFGGSF